MAFHQKFLAAYIGGHVEIWHADGLRIARRCIFDIHGDVIDEVFADDGGELFRESAVGVELDLIAKGFDGAQEIGDIWLQQRLTTADADAVEQALAFFQKSEHGVGVFPGTERPADELTVVAIGTVELAAAGEQRRGDVLRIIQEGEFL